MVLSRNELILFAVKALTIFIISSSFLYQQSDKIDGAISSGAKKLTGLISGKYVRGEVKRAGGTTVVKFRVPLKQGFSAVIPPAYQWGYPMLFAIIIATPLISFPRKVSHLAIGTAALTAGLYMQIFFAWFYLYASIPGMPETAFLLINGTASMFLAFNSLLGAIAFPLAYCMAAHPFPKKAENISIEIPAN